MYSLARKTLLLLFIYCVIRLLWSAEPLRKSCCCTEEPFRRLEP